MESNKSPIHEKTIIHIDIDCFYAQVELLRRPHLKNEPVGVKQKNIVVTCNYPARKFGIKKCMSVSEALQLCPQLFLFNGEDLYKYRQASNQIHLMLLSFSSKVEKSGLDENYLDVTDLVKERKNKDKFAGEIIGHCEGDVSQECACGCHKRLIIGSQIAQEIRTKLMNELSFTSCCGISHNKILAKICCSAHKPNQQTTLLPNGVLRYLQSLINVERIPGIGEKTKQVLQAVNIKTVKDLQEADLKTLKSVFKNKESAVNVKNLSLGICDSQVKLSGKLNSIGVENGFIKISVESDVKKKFKLLLERLMVLVEEDGRMPMTVKVTIRKHNPDRKMGTKESKQSPLPSCLFSRSPIKLTEDSANKLLNVIMGLFCKMVNIFEPFHITLLGLAFSKFHQRGNLQSVASFLLNKQDLSVQSLTNFVSYEMTADTTDLPVLTCSQSESDSDLEPSPKKTKLDVIVNKMENKTEIGVKDIEMHSPSKLSIENLHLNENLNFAKEIPHVDPDVFRELPQDLQKEIIREWRMTNIKPSQKPSKQSFIHMYCTPKNKI